MRIPKAIESRSWAMALWSVAGRQRRVQKALRRVQIV